jgi:hypothetical protein
MVWAVAQGSELAKVINAKVTVVTATEPWTAMVVGEAAVAFPYGDYEKAASENAAKILERAAALVSSTARAAAAAPTRASAIANDHRRRVTFERGPERALNDQRRGEHDEKKDSKQVRKLAGKCNDRIAARARKPPAHAASLELDADRVAGGERDHDVHNHRQQRTQRDLRCEATGA